MPGETIGVLRPTVTAGRFDDDTTTFPSTPTHLIHDVAVAPGSSTEDHDGRSAVVTGLTLYMPAGSDVRPTDQLLIRGLVYEADGDLADWRNPFVAGHGGLVQVVKRVAG